MEKHPTSQSGISNSSVLLAFSLWAAGAFFGVLAVAATAELSPDVSVILTASPGSAGIPGDIIGKSAAPVTVAGTPSGCSSPGDDDRCEAWVTTVPRELAGVPYGSNRAFAATMSPDGAVEYITGDTSPIPIYGQGNVLTTAIDVGTGATLWQAVFDASPSGDNYARYVAVSPGGGEVVVLGYYDRLPRVGFGVGFDIAVVAYNATTGEQLWTASYDRGGGYETGPAPGPASSLAFSADGATVVITGAVDANGEVGFVRAYDTSDGHVRWTRVGGGAPAYGRGIVAAESSIYTLASVSQTGDIVATCYDSLSGEIAWSTAINLGQGAQAQRLAIDPVGGKLFAVAIAQPYLPQEYTAVFDTVAYDASTGINLWVATYKGDFVGGINIPTAIAAGPEVTLDDGSRQARVYVTGLVVNRQFGDYDFGTIAYDAATGVQLFDARYGTPRDERAWALAVSTDGSRVYMTGRNGPPYSGGASGGSAVDLMTIGYDGGTGEQLWAARYATATGDGGDPVGVNVSRDGRRVVTAGTLNFNMSPEYPRDFVALGYLENLPVQLLGVVSRKVHGSTGQFDINLPLTGTPGIECRSAGVNGDHTLVFSFATPLTSVGEATVSSGTGSVSSSAIDSSDARNYIVNLTGVTNAQVVTISLANVNDSAGNSSASISVPLGVLLGDVNGNGRVSNADVGAVKAQVGATLSETDSVFRHDVNANGTISNGDVGDTKAQVGSRLP